jgi:pyruvate formate lyase activating enzyme
MNKPALYWHAGEKQAVRCGLCPKECHIAEGAAGVCGGRRNIGGALFATGYGKLSSLALDPIEKKPLHRFYPGSMILSAGGFGCNLRCPFCQNSAISLEYGQSLQTAEYLPPEKLAALAKETVSRGNIGVVYTYNEPLINIEYLLDCAALVREAGLKNVLVTNGFVNPEPLEQLLPAIDAMNIDLKAFTESFYNKLGGNLEPVKRTIELARRHCHVEVTTLLIPGENDADIIPLSEWLASLSPEIPLHLSRFFPRQKYRGRQATPRESVLESSEAARKRLSYVHAGNM